ncbi:MAG TPA: AraC family transcriptional regulator [Gammaproteobacteria bacterium]|nr:AraC family transcriptional regulator [Gammaproteobacteria bacterium]
MVARWIASTCLVMLAFGGGLASAQGTAGETVVAAAAPEFANADAQSAAARDESRTLDEDVQGLKKQVLDLNRDLFLLEEELLFPASTQVAVFVSMDVGEYFGLDSVELKLDNKNVTNYLYTEREVDALVKGGVQRVFLGNLKAGEHELVAVFTGQGPHTRDYRRGASLKFEKGIGPKYIELTISDRESKQQPEFVVKEWE